RRRWLGEWLLRCDADLGGAQDPVKERRLHHIDKGRQRIREPTFALDRRSVVPRSTCCPGPLDPGECPASNQLAVLWPHTTVGVRACHEVRILDEGVVIGQGGARVAKSGKPLDDIARNGAPWVISTKEGWHRPSDGRFPEGRPSCTISRTAI